MQRSVHPWVHSCPLPGLRALRWMWQLWSPGKVALLLALNGAPLQGISIVVLLSQTCWTVGGFGSSCLDPWTRRMGCQTMIGLETVLPRCSKQPQSGGMSSAHPPPVLVADAKDIA
ncbi:uncharacterized protein B0I36DRAFT_326358 [Microdochium trichocladiopsis]|uniref:Uncharacterized protein n=1 Tax=Microdochium trichocladiopsis TaxID=1682393 RepID=A0A9P8Y814_9PEZI|nr:uncharacterized protein B0I36DRAFT_326358 [Microdochium trichocladiopsis]KAH7029782.1 hypothetical protein B0I36DRAFT_326358 [Microdochium trichocladiopsis]